MLGLNRMADWSLSMRLLLWLSSQRSGFLPQPETMHIRPNGYSRFPAGVNVEDHDRVLKVNTTQVSSFTPEVLVKILDVPVAWSLTM